MANRGYKLQEFVAHASDVKCLNIGKKSSRVFITGGEDRKVNLWAIGKPTSLLSLSGHTSPVESVAFDSTEALVLAGSSNGMVKLWDLEEAKVVRTLTAHRSSCISVGFHPFGEFFASGSLDTDLKIWDIRKKGCIHTYKGHTRGIRTIKFSPDGRWVVTGGDDNVVKVWDLTAGKLLHDFKFHNGLISCMDFHPQEFLLATGSADRTVKFWDLETFELIGSAGPEVTGVRSMIFHHDGRTLFCGLDETLKVLSWEPIRCHDVVDMGWSTLADLSVYEGKLFGCSYHRSCVAVWVADISLIEPYALGVVPKTNGLVDSIYSHEESDLVKLAGSNAISCATSTIGLLDCVNKTKETLKSPCVISSQCSQGAPQDYASNLNSVDSSGYKRNKTTIGSRITPQKNDSKFSSIVRPLNSTTFGVRKATESRPSPVRRIESGFSSRDVSPSSKASCESRPLTRKEGHNSKARTMTKLQATGGPISMPVIVPRDSADLDTSVSSRKETGNTERSCGTLTRESTHKRKPSFVGGSHESQLSGHTSGSFSGVINSSEVRSPNFLSRPTVSGETAEADEGNHNSIRNVAEKFERIMSMGQPVEDINDKYAESICSSSETSPVKYVRGVAVQLGKTRSLVESWERRERWNSGYTATTSSSSEEVPRVDILPSIQKGQVESSDKDLTSADDNSISEAVLQNHVAFLNAVKSRLTKLQMVRHFWERNGIRGAINAVAKLPDDSVHVDVISILMEKVDLFTLDLFLSVLPLLTGLLNSKAESPLQVVSKFSAVDSCTITLDNDIYQSLHAISSPTFLLRWHITISLEMLVKLLKVFGSVIRSTRSAPQLVGVDLEAEQRLERCNQCFIHLEKIKQLLPLLIRRGGLLAKLAQGLNLALHDL